MTANELLMQMGWSGILAAALCFMFRTYAAAQAGRIEALEKHCEALESQLGNCNEKIWALFQERLNALPECPDNCPMRAAAKPPVADG